MAGRSPSKPPAWATRSLPALPGLAVARPPEAEATTARRPGADPAETPTERAPRAEPLSVSALTARIKATLSASFSGVRVSGELSQLTVAASGHWYFTLVDAGAALSCVMFRGVATTLGWAPAAGTVVELVGDIDVYAPRGSYNLIVRQLRRAGEGDRRAQLEALKRRLAAEGLTDPARKRALPRHPRVIGVATSPTGAALHDIRRVLQERLPGLTLIFAPCQVQGADAPASIVRALRALARDGRAELIIVGRGGGSAEDLAAFDEEAVARAIAASPIPTISAVGHEVDVSVADLVADLRAATPSHAAELAVPARAALLATLHRSAAALHGAARRDLERRRRRVQAVRVPTPALVIARAHARLDGLRARLGGLGAAAVPLRRRQLQPRAERLARAATSLVPARRARVEGLRARLLRRSAELLPGRRARLGALGAELLALDPRRVLDRGYALVMDGDKVVLDAAGRAPGEALTLVLRDGRLRVRVEALLPPDGG